MSDALVFIGVFIGIVCIAEGLAYMLAPRFVETLLKALAEFSVGQRRLMGASIFLAGFVIFMLCWPNVT